VGFARNGLIVDELLQVIKSMTEGMKAMLKAIEILEARIEMLEQHDYSKDELEKIMIDLGFSNE
jgi:hypothetical protein